MTVLGIRITLLRDGAFKREPFGGIFAIWRMEDQMASISL